MPRKKLGAVKKEKKPKYLVSLNYNEKVTELKGDSLEQIFLDYTPDVFKSMVTIKITSGEKSVERLWPVIKARRVFNNHNTALIEASLMEKLLA